MIITIGLNLLVSLVMFLPFSAELPLERKCCFVSNNMLLSAFLAQVLFCYEQFDELTLLHLREFDKKKLISVETDIVVDHYKEEKFEESRPGIVRFPWPFLLHAVLPPCVSQ